MGTEITSASELVPTSYEEKIQEIEAIAAECGTLDRLGSFQQTFALARNMRRLRELITPEMMADIMELQGTQLGFTTDKDREGGKYPVQVVKDVTVEAVIRGFRMTGNEVCVIGGKFYGGKNGYRRKILEFPDLKDFEILIGIPQVSSTGAVVSGNATWTLGGVKQELGERKIPVRVNQGMIVDAIVGKTERKVMAKVWEKLTGQSAPDGDPDDDGAIETTSRTSNGASKSENLAQRLRPTSGASAAPSAPAATDDPAAVDAAIARCNALIDQIDQMKEGSGMSALEKATGQITFDGLSLAQLRDAEAYLKATLDKVKAESGAAPKAAPNSPAPRQTQPSGKGSPQADLLP